ncbi:MAG: hypothetical protein KC422_20075 [Trueperaceae bacterium]|nr:hypothetical protein [Trueperaceae bacterium]
MKRFIILLSLVLVALLSACGPSTRLITDIDAMPFIPEGEGQGSSTIDSNLELKIPDDTGFSAEDMGLSKDTLSGLARFSLDVVTELSLSEEDAPMDVTMGLYLNGVAPAFDAEKPFEVQAHLIPGEAQDTHLTIVMSEEENPGLFQTLKSGNFFLGIAYTSVGEEGGVGTLSAKLKGLDFQLIADVNDISGF